MAKAELLDRQVRLFDGQIDREVTPAVADRFDRLSTFYTRMREAIEGAMADQAGSATRSTAAEVPESFGSRSATRAR